MTLPLEELSMKLPSNAFKAALAQGKRQPGLWLTLESVNATEVVAGSGYDWLLLDMEHTGLDVSQIADHIRAARGGTAELVVRIPWNESPQHAIHRTVFVA
jgi:4-hydroxy-2-oxoheptanedioate aldolase